MKKSELIEIVIKNFDKKLVLDYFLKFDDSKSFPEEILNKLTKKELEAFLPIIYLENGWKPLDK